MQIVINGVGGQGVIFLTKILTLSALNIYKKVTTSETIGMAQRGGSVISFMKMGENYKSPMIIPGTADMLICLQEQELANSRGYLKEQGIMYVNSEQGFNADKLALKEKQPSMSNVIFLGFLAQDKNFPLKREDILPVLPEKLEKFFLLGYNAVLK